MEKDLISVIVPVYKVEEYLNRCVDSIINQTYKNLEIILVDDGSPDNCGKICDEYAKLDKRIKVIHKKNGGLSDARNAGLSVAKGKYIGFVDSDDYISENMYEILYKELVKNKADISICKYIYFKNKIPEFTTDYEITSYTNKEAILELIKIKQRKIQDYAWNKLYKRKLFKKIRYPKNFVFEDIGTTYLLFYEAKKIINIDCILYAYYDNSNSITSNKNPKNISDIIEMTTQRSKFLLKNFNEYKDSIILNRNINILCALLRGTHYNDKEFFFSKKIQRVRELLKNSDKKLMKSKLIPLRYRIQYKLLCFNKNLFYIANKIYDFIKRVVLKFKNY